METYWLKFVLLSDATFGASQASALGGIIDIQHDRYGLPYLGGRTLKGLLKAECEGLLYSIRQAAPHVHSTFEESALRLFGSGGELGNQGIMSVGNACLPSDLREIISHRYPDLGQDMAAQYLDSLTALRTYSATDATGTSSIASLRTARVILRGIRFEARLLFAMSPALFDRALLAACMRAFRRAGLGCRRGRGQLRADLYSPDGELCITDQLLAEFEKMLLA